MTNISNPVMSGDIKTLARISLPLMLFLFCEAFALFCERVFLSYHSVDAIHASLNANYLASIFQMPCIAIALMAQIFVGLYQGGQEYERIGPCVWQLIWFSFLSFLITLPLSFLASSWYFGGTVIQKIGIEYFMILSFGNFLFPLNTALSSFYLGRGKTLLVTTLMLVSYATHLLLSWFLIFGIEGVFPPLGIKGAPLAKCISLGIVSSTFLGAFLTKKNRQLYDTGAWHFRPLALWNYMRPGFVRAFGFLSSRIWWVSISYVIIKKGGIYLDVLTIGGTIIIFLSFINNGIYRAVLTIASNLIGAKKQAEIWKLCRSFVIYIAAILTLLTIPLFLFPDSLIYFFDSSSKAVFKETFKNINHWIWFYILAIAIQSSFCALLVAWRNLKLQFYSYLFLCPVSFVLVYFGIGLGGWTADKLWLVMTIENIIFLLFLLIWCQKKRGEERQMFSSSSS